MDRTIRYVLHPRTVRSRHDGDRHYIEADRLACLYGVDIRKCRISRGEIDERGRHDEQEIHLYPRYSGDYRLPEKS